MYVHRSHISVLLLSVLLFFTACQGSSTQSASQLAVEDLHFSRTENKSRVVSGFVRNSGDGEVRSAVVQVDLLDDRNQVLEKIQIDVDPIPAGERISFRKVLDTDRAVHGIRARQIFIF